MAWIMSVIAGFLEMAGPFVLKYRFTRLGPTVGTAAALVWSRVLRGLAVRSLPLGGV